MNFNWLVIPTLAISLLLFAVGRWSTQRCASGKARTLLASIYFLLGLPGFLFALYYLHLFDDAVCFYECRAIPFVELVAAGAGLFAGSLAGELKERVPAVAPLFVAMLVLGIIAPHSKTLLDPLPDNNFKSRWKDEVCLQSTPSSCGAASAATIFRQYGESLSEQEIARECFTYRGGTENWYLARAFRRRGYTVEYRIEDRFPEDLQTPAIAGVRIRGVGHFIVILEKENGVYITGDPLSGREEVPVDKIMKRFSFTGFFMETGCR